MRLVENYLSQASALLPKNLREDVVAELRSSLEEQILDRATAEHREPDIDDEKAILKNFGHPMKVAGSFRPQQYLIGPSLFPAYLYVSKIILAVVLVINLALALIISDWGISILSLFWHLLDVVITTMVIITLVFIAIEYSGEKLNWYDNWKPDALDHGPSTPVDHQDLFTDLIAEGVLLLWWNGGLSFSNWLEFADTTLEMSAVWALLFWPVNVVLGAFFLLHAYLAVRGNWRTRTLVLECILDIAFVVLCVILLLSDSLVELSSTASAQQYHA